MIEEFKPGDEIRMSELIGRAFEIFIAPDYSEEGIRTFRSYTGAETILERYRSGDLILLYKEEGRITGVFEVREGNHICLFFVDPDRHGKGTGRALLNELLRRIGGRFDHITVNASPYAEKIYLRLGFSRSADKEVTNGIVHIPMTRRIVI